ncbi:hypothetical protein [Pseudomarimonas arenosa]|uniref:Glycosyltransferase RgtA/B/C/D-like domain-containing protein n=1 Tax=Pseudomarimonas arenosa TaxID=2774145 RepID=A0AAW3ZGT9_9GAMM|nr:hypothetical protein [Pseudomarimonas arenosa]MBD8524185.1 hypothetical protein [Pseudomarimonas arenosa]
MSFVYSSAATRKLPWLLLLTATAFIPGLLGPFVLDDHANFQLLFAWWSGETSLSRAIFDNGSGPLQRPISYLTFAMNMAIFGEQPFGFKALSLVFHLLTALALAALLNRLLTVHGMNERRAAAWSMICAAAWAIHPLQVSTVLYSVQRMEVLSSLAQILAVLAYIQGRTLQASQARTGLLWLWLAFPATMAAGMLCKENAILALPLALAVEVSALNCLPKTRSVWAWTGILCLGVVAIVLFAATDPGYFFGGYAARDFDLWQRLITEPRVLSHYLLATFLPFDQNLYLFRDGLPISTSWAQPISTLLSIVGLLAVSALAFGIRRSRPLLSLGLLWWLVCHSLEAGPLSLELAFEHRNYLALAGLLIAALGLAPTKLLAHRHSLWLASISLLLPLWLLCVQRSYAWGDLDRLLSAESPPPPQVSRRLQVIEIARGIEANDPGRTQRAFAALENSGADNATIAATWHAIVDCSLEAKLSPSRRAAFMQSRPSVMTFQHANWLGMLSRRVDNGGCDGLTPADLQTTVVRWLEHLKKPPHAISMRQLRDQRLLPQDAER